MSDLQEEAIWLLSSGRPNQSVTGIAGCRPFDDPAKRQRVLKNIRGRIDGANKCPGFQHDLTQANPYLPLRLLVPDEGAAEFRHIYSWVIQQMRKAR